MGWGGGITVQSVKRGREERVLCVCVLGGGGV